MLRELARTSIPAAQPFTQPSTTPHTLLVGLVIGLVAGIVFERRRRRQGFLGALGLKKGAPSSTPTPSFSAAPLASASSGGTTRACHGHHTVAATRKIAETTRARGRTGEAELEEFSDFASGSWDNVTVSDPAFTLGVAGGLKGSAATRGAAQQPPPTTPHSAGVGSRSSNPAARTPPGQTHTTPARLEPANEGGPNSIDALLVAAKIATPH